jgi:hypothetical protein
MARRYTRPSHGRPRGPPLRSCPEPYRYRPPGCSVRIGCPRRHGQSPGSHTYHSSPDRPCSRPTCGAWCSTTKRRWNRSCHPRRRRTRCRRSGRPLTCPNRTRTHSHPVVDDMKLVRWGGRLGVSGSRLSVSRLRNTNAMVRATTVVTTRAAEGCLKSVMTTLFTSDNRDTRAHFSRLGHHLLSTQYPFRRLFTPTISLRWLARGCRPQHRRRPVR